VTGRDRGSVALAALALLAGWSAAADTPRASGSPAEQVESGKALYAQHCSHCHGFGMVNPGNVVPDLREFPSDDKQRFVDTVMHGKNNRMPPWGDILSSAEIDELWTYIQTRGK
jgi:cytochrome c55X